MQKASIALLAGVACVLSLIAVSPTPASARKWCSSDCVRECKVTLVGSIKGETLADCIHKWACYTAFPEAPCAGAQAVKIESRRWCELWKREC